MTSLNNMEIGSAESVIDRFLRAALEHDAAMRNTLLIWTTVDDVAYWCRDGMSEGREALSNCIGKDLQRTGDIRIQRTSDVQALRDVARVSWEVQTFDENSGFQRGESYFEFNADGRIRTIVSFSDPPHYIPIGGGPQVYIDAWNSDGESERREILAGRWADDGRWVELKFDKSGPDDVCAMMNSVIHLKPVGGLMDVIDLKGVGSQIRFQVDVTKRTGEAIGRFTDFVELDAEGRVKRLAGFRGGVLLPDRKSGLVDPDWHWSYRAGYLDPTDNYAGGSEIMHVIPHKGKLYAANGYWEDSHWVVPDDMPRQSAQILRLDSSAGQWEVDLDMGRESTPGLNFMKGNLLKSVTFTQHLDGSPLVEPHNILVAAAGTIRTHVCVWVKDDQTGKWSYQIVKHGPHQSVERGTPGLKRWVPRAMEIHIDQVTGQERLFLLLGNPGIISGRYDPDAASKIRWEPEIEYPENGFLDVRPLGMAIANGNLYFSGGGSIYQRIDGPKPTYTRVYTIDDVPDVEMGGIRGLSAVNNPDGSGQSLIFMWVPSRETMGWIRRLDPDGSGGFTSHDEIEVRSLIEDVLGTGSVKKSVLGAYNEFYPLTNPETGQTCHLIGFQARVAADPSRLCLGHYAGGMYAIRTPDKRYFPGEINGSYVPGKPVLKGPRSFALSPFEDGRIFAGGNDSNFIPSTDMAWIFSADMSVWLSPLKGDSDTHK